MTANNIISKYPELFENCWEFEVPDAWLEPIAKLCSILRCRNTRLNTTKEFAQIKTKFGYPRIYLMEYEVVASNWARHCEKHIQKLIENENRI